MENFFNYITKPVRPEDVDVWFRSNNIIPEKLELFYDFTYSLNMLILDTYLGSNGNDETKIVMSTDDIENHFKWCWNKTVENFISLVTGAKEWLDPNIGEKVKQIFTTELFSTE